MYIINKLKLSDKDFTSTRDSLGLFNGMNGQPKERYVQIKELWDGLKWVTAKVAEQS